VDWVETYLAVVAAASLAVEIIALVGRRLGKRWSPISPVMRDDGKQWLTIPMLWGVLPGHWWSPITSPGWGAFVLIGLALAVLARDLWNRCDPVPASRFEVFGVFLGGVLAGAALWSQGG
jgi:hypothetical protein